MSARTDMVVDILKNKGEWGEATALVKTIAKELKISERQAYRDLKKAWEDKKVKRWKLPDHTLYGLPNWGFPITSEEKKDTLSFQDAFRYQCFKELHKIGKLKDEGRVGLAYTRLKRLKNMLSPAKRDKLDPIFKEADAILAKPRRYGFYSEMLKKLHRTEFLVETLIGEVSKVLHES